MLQHPREVPRVLEANFVHLRRFASGRPCVRLLCDFGHDVNLRSRYYGAENAPLLYDY